jgi:hypothetical protein
MPIPGPCEDAVRSLGPPAMLLWCLSHLAGMLTTVGYSSREAWMSLLGV